MDLVIKLGPDPRPPLGVGPVPNVLGPTFLKHLAELEEIDREQKEHHRMSHTEAIETLKAVVRAGEDKIKLDAKKIETLKADVESALEEIDGWIENIRSAVSEAQQSLDSLEENTNDYAKAVAEIKDINEALKQTDDREEKTNLREEKKEQVEYRDGAKDDHEDRAADLVSRLEDLIAEIDLPDTTS